MDETSDLLTGYAEIGGFLRLSLRQTKHLAEAGDLPVFRLTGRTVHARKGTLVRWLAEREAEARKGRSDG